MATSAPASAKSKAIALPIPLLPPVTIATLPSKEKAEVSILLPPYN
jgi:hypothetical protein